MNIGILGTGMVAKTIAGKLDSLGHTVKLGTRDVKATLARSEPDMAGGPPVRTWLEKYPRVTLAGHAEAAAHGQLVINALSGQGVRDVTRVAGGDPDLYAQIIRGNAAVVAELLRGVRGQLDQLITAVDGGSAEDLVEILDRGRSGTQVIPGKHGGAPLETGPVFVLVPDHPGELARLFADIGEIGVNVEDLRIDHDPGRPSGLVELQVEASAADRLREALESRNWTTHR